MAGTINKLSPTKVAALIRARKPGLYGDGAGLGLRVGPSGAASWVLRYMRQGQAREMGLGPTHTVGLAEARERARRQRQALLDGIDPLAARAAAKAAASPIVTFAQVAEMYLTAHAPGWRSEIHRQQWRQTLKDYVLPILGEQDVTALDTGAVMGVLEALWHTKPETASRVRGRIEAILNYASARGWRKADNPARWRGHLENLLPRKTKIAPVQHHAALPWRAVPEFIAALRSRQSMAARAVELAVLTAARSGEARGARWNEIDLGRKIWSIPASRMKSGRPHRVPLADSAITVLEGVALLRQDNDGLVFPGMRGSPLTDTAVSKIAKLCAPGAELTLHGLRSSFRDWAGETTNHSREVIEQALAHRVGDAAEQAYARGDLFDKRRRLMDDWAAFCTATEEVVA